MKNKIIRFIMMGGCSTLIDFIIYMLVSRRIDISISKGISMICSSVFSYIANKNFTFSNREKTNAVYLIKFYVVFAVNFITNISINRLVYIHTKSKFISFVLATTFGMTVNYIGQRFMVFGGGIIDGDV